MMALVKINILISHAKNTFFYLKVHFFPFWLYKKLEHFPGPLKFSIVTPSHVPTISNGKVSPASDTFIHVILITTQLTDEEAEQRERL